MGRPQQVHRIRIPYPICYRRLQIQRTERILMPGLVIDREVLIEAPAEVV
jgi:hypothetical protein